MSFLAFVLAMAAADPVSPPSAPIAFTTESIAWRDAPPSLPKGAKVAVLEGDPTKPGLVTMRLKLPQGAELPLHTHPADERVTVLGGAMKVRVGDVERVLPAGSFYVTPKGTKHSFAVDEDTVIQVTVEGPWSVQLVAAPPRAR